MVKEAEYFLATCIQIDDIKNRKIAEARAVTNAYLKCVKDMKKRLKEQERQDKIAARAAPAIVVNAAANTSLRPSRNARTAAIDNIRKQTQLNLNTKLRRPDGDDDGYASNYYSSGSSRTTTCSVPDENFARPKPVARKRGRKNVEQTVILEESDKAEKQPQTPSSSVELEAGNVQAKEIPSPRAGSSRIIESEVAPSRTEENKVAPSRKISSEKKEFAPSKISPELGKVAPPVTPRSVKDRIKRFEEMNRGAQFTSTPFKSLRVLVPKVFPKTKLESKTTVALIEESPIIDTSPAIALPNDSRKSKEDPAKINSELDKAETIPIAYSSKSGGNRVQTRSNSAGVESSWVETRPDSGGDKSNLVQTLLNAVGEKSNRVQTQISCGVESNRVQTLPISIGDESNRVQTPIFGEVESNHVQTLPNSAGYESVPVQTRSRSGGNEAVALEKSSQKTEIRQESTPKVTSANRSGLVLDAEPSICISPVLSSTLRPVNETVDEDIIDISFDRSTRQAAREISAAATNMNKTTVIVRASRRSSFHVENVEADERKSKTVSFETASQGESSVNTEGPTRASKRTKRLENTNKSVSFDTASHGESTYNGERQMRSTRTKNLTVTLEEAPSRPKRTRAKRTKRKNRNSDDIFETSGEGVEELPRPKRTRAKKAKRTSDKYVTADESLGNQLKKNDSDADVSNNVTKTLNKTPGASFTVTRSSKRSAGMAEIFCNGPETVIRAKKPKRIMPVETSEVDNHEPEASFAQPLPVGPKRTKPVKPTMFDAEGNPINRNAVTRTKTLKGPTMADVPDCADGGRPVRTRTKVRRFGEEGEQTDGSETEPEKRSTRTRTKAKLAEIDTNKAVRARLSKSKRSSKVLTHAAISKLYGSATKMKTPLSAFGSATKRPIMVLKENQMTCKKRNEPPKVVNKVDDHDEREARYNSKKQKEELATMKKQQVLNKKREEIKLKNEEKLLRAQNNRAKLENERLAKQREAELEHQRIAQEKQRQQELEEKRARERLEEKRKMAEMEKIMKAKAAQARAEADRVASAPRSGYNMAPYLPKSENDIGLEDEDTEGSDDEERAESTKTIPEWAIAFKKRKKHCHVTTEQIAAYLPIKFKTPDIHRMFNLSPSRMRRNSSAIWDNTIVSSPWSH